MKLPNLRDTYGRTLTETCQENRLQRQKRKDRYLAFYNQVSNTIGLLGFGSLFISVSWFFHAIAQEVAPPIWASQGELFFQPHLQPEDPCPFCQIWLPGIALGLALIAFMIVLEAHLVRLRKSESLA